jgi:alpha-ketoglutarate-dependent taurine dioxygenase
MWDNRCTLHARTDFSPNERRLMRRVTILGEKPVGTSKNSSRQVAANLTR